MTESDSKDLDRFRGFLGSPAKLVLDPGESMGFRVDLEEPIEGLRRTSDRRPTGGTC